MPDISWTRFLRLIRRFGFFGLLRSIFFRTVGPGVALLIPTRTEKAIRKFLGSDGERGKVLLIYSTLDWNFPYEQRTHHIARALADLGWKIIFFSPLHGYDHFFWGCNARRDVLVTFDFDTALRCINQPIVYLNSADARLDSNFLQALRSRRGRVVYDYLDAFDNKVSNAPLSEARHVLHRDLLKDSVNCLCIATAEDLLRDIKKYRDENFLLVSNGVDFEHFRVERARDGLRADFLRILDAGKPIAGYYGALAEWLDYSLLKKLAIENPDINVVLIGPNYDGSTAVLSPKPANLHILDPIKYGDLPRHAIWFDVALVPFGISEITNATSPLKLFEYMALGLPTVVTDFYEAHKYESVVVCATHEGFVRSVRDFATLPQGNSCREASLAEALRNDWKAKAMEISNAIPVCWY